MALIKTSVLQISPNTWLTRNQSSALQPNQPNDITWLHRPVIKYTVKDYWKSLYFASQFEGLVKSQRIKLTYRWYCRLWKLTIVISLAILLCLKFYPETVDDKDWKWNCFVVSLNKTVCSSIITTQNMLSVLTGFIFTCMIVIVFIWCLETVQKGILHSFVTEWVI